MSSEGKVDVKTVRKQGALLVRLWGRMVSLISDPASDSLADEVLAKKLGVSKEELEEFMTEKVVAEAMAKRAGGVSEREVHEVDRAMLARAREGHVGAARLLYARVAGKGEAVDEGPLPTLEELEEELVRMGFMG